MLKTGYIYILTNQYNTTLYVGVTSDLCKRIYEHKNKVIEGFTKRYNLSKLVYYEICDNIELAITREKFLKGKSRNYKISLINKINPDWDDLYNEIL